MGRKKRAPPEPSPPPDFDFTKLCPIWKRLGADGNQYPVKISELALAMRPQKAMLGLRSGQSTVELWTSGIPNWHGDCLMRFKTSKNASFLVIYHVHLKFTFLIYAREGTPNPWNLQGRPLVLANGFDATRELVCRWLSTCLKEHPRCGSGAAARLPTRVLDVGLVASDPVKLYASQGEDARYICLTYCWGNAQFIKTTKETLEDHQKNIQFDLFPQTFRDTILIARALGIRYVWIDSLCIIQDDSADWAHESMAPGWAKSPTSGCFPPSEKGLEVESVLAREVFHFYKRSVASRDDHFPLLARPWTYQERILSPRILYFSGHESIWDCRDVRICECGGARHVENELNKGGFYNLVSDQQSLDNKAYNHRQLWRTMVTEYTTHQLSHLSDRLPAILGLANEMQHRRKSEYLAGLWRDTLIQDMCWRKVISSPPPTRKVDKGRLRTPLNQQRAPTWSWGSVDHPIEFIPWTFKPWQKVLHYPIILDVQVPLPNSTRIANHSGFVELKSSLVPIRPQHEFNSLLSYFSYLEVAGCSFFFYVDMTSATYDSRECYLMPLMSVDDAFCGLIVKPWNGSSEDMIRVGLVYDNLELARIKALTNQKKQRIRLL
ncbi:hypothetical protein V8F33_001878 [Rhypophila sp. PSN 637]